MCICATALHVNEILYCCTVGGMFGKEVMVEGNEGNGAEPQIDAIYLENKMLPEGVGSMSPVLSHAVLPLLVCLHQGLLWLVCVFPLSLFGHTTSSYRNSH